MKSICNLYNIAIYASRIPENKENKIENEHELSKLTTAPPKDTAAFDNNNVFAKVNSQGSGTYNP
jgi:hypothetical protein